MSPNWLHIPCTVQARVPNLCSTDAIKNEGQALPSMSLRNSVK